MEGSYLARELAHLEQKAGVIACLGMDGSEPAGLLEQGPYQSLDKRLVPQIFQRRQLAWAKELRGLRAREQLDSLKHGRLLIQLMPGPEEVARRVGRAPLKQQPQILPIGERPPIKIGEQRAWPSGRQAEQFLIEIGEQ